MGSTLAEKRSLNKATYETEIREYFGNLNFYSEELVYRLMCGVCKITFERFMDVYPIDKPRIMSKEEIAQAHDIRINSLFANINGVKRIILQIFPNFFQVYYKKTSKINEAQNDKMAKLENFYGTSDIHLIKKIIPFFDQYTATIMLLYCPLNKPEGTSVDFISNYTNLSKPETRKIIESASVSFRKIVEELKIDSIMRHKINKTLLTMENQIEIRIIQLIFGLYDGNRYSVGEAADKLKIDQEFIKDILVNFLKTLHNDGKKLH